MTIRSGIVRPGSEQTPEGSITESHLTSGAVVPDHLHADTTALLGAAGTLADLTASAAELNLNDGSVAGTLVASKSVVLSASKALDEAIRVNVYNASGGTLTAGTPVYLAGTHTTGAPKVVKADANATGAAATHVVVDDITNNTAGVVATQFLSAATLNTDSYSAAGDPGYLSETVGTLSVTAPTAAGSIKQVVALVVVKSATVGQLLYSVQPPSKVGTNELQDDSVTNAKLSPSALKTYKFTYDFAVNGGAAGAITLTAADGQLPDNFIVKSAVMHTKTAAVSGGAATIAVGITGNTDGFIAATAYTDNKFDVNDQVTTFAGDQIGVITGAAVNVIFTVADADLTAGKHIIWVEGYESE